MKSEVTRLRLLSPLSTLSSSLCLSKPQAVIGCMQLAVPKAESASESFNTASGNSVHATEVVERFHLVGCGVSIPQAVIGCMQQR